MRVNGSIPSLVNGVSQQPHSLRLPTQAEEQVNAVSSLTEGLSKRPPLTHVTKVNGLGYVKPFIHFINRDAVEKYVCLFYPKSITVIDKDGNHLPVIGDPDDLEYLDSNNPYKNIKALSVSDVTFVLNRGITAHMSGHQVPERPFEVMVWVRAGSYKTEYTIKIYGTSVTVTTDDTDLDTIQTNQIAEDLKTALVADLPSGEYTVTRKNSILWIRRVDEKEFVISVGDSNGDRNMSLVTDVVPNFSELPPIAPNGFTTMVKGSIENSSDDYWVSFETYRDDPFGHGIWNEVPKPGVKSRFDAATLPHVLIRRQDTDGTVTGTVGQIYFSWEQYSWRFRICGDNETAPAPSFIDRTISDIFIHRSRLGLLSQGNVIFSQTGVFNNFWKQTALTLLDDDPIDVYLAHNRAVNLRHAKNFNSGLLLFSDHTQFFLKGGDILSPKTVSTTVATEYSSHIDAAPVNAENLIYFPFDDGQFSGMREYYVDGNTQQHDSKTITEHCPRYLEGSTLRVEVSPVQDMMFVSTNENRNRLYVYKWFWNGNQKLQSAWSHWEFGTNTTVAGFGFLGDTLYVIHVETDGTYLSSVQLDPGATDSYATYQTLLDRRVHDATPGVVKSYDDRADTTTIKPPFRMDMQDEWVVVTRANGVDGYAPGRVCTQTSDKNPDTITVRGDVTGGFWLGRKYEMRYTFSRAYLRTQGQITGGVDTVTEGRLQLLDWSVKYGRSGYARLEVTPENRDTATYPMTGQVIKSPALGTLGLGDVQLRDGVLRAPVLAKNDQVTVRVVNDSHLPCYLSSAEWVANYTSQAKRV